jgi:hypothetical protein
MFVDQLQVIGTKKSHVATRGSRRGFAAPESTTLAYK